LRVPRDSDSRKTALAKPAAYEKDRPVLSSERAPHKNKAITVNSNKYLVTISRCGSTPKLTD
jgi:hypothetical protein